MQGDILGLQDGAGTMVVYYRYDAWGRLTSQYGSLVATLGSLNPFRYRGYVYDEETALYYLRSRYYNPWWGRFISTDSILGQVGGLLQHNPFIYCGNNPIIHIDIDGDFWDTAFDIISLGVSIAEVVVNPTDPWAWLGLAGNFIDLIPFVTGVGETTRAIKMTVSLADGATDVISDARKSYHALSKLANADMLINATGSYEIVFES